MTTKYCEGCKTWHQADAFSKKTDAADGLNPYCRVYNRQLQTRRNKQKQEDKKFYGRFMPV